MLRKFFIAALAVALAAPLAAQDWRGTARLEGRVTDSDGKPLAEVTVKLDNPERGGGPTLKTDKKGRWAFLGLVGGTWKIDFHADGYTPKGVSLTIESEAERLPPVEVTLEKAKPTGPPPEVVAALDAAEAEFKQGRYAEARAEFEKLLDKMPQYAKAIHQRIGLTYIQEHDYPKAVEQLDMVLAADPGNQQIRAIAAQAALEGGMIDKGRELIAGLDETAIKDPDVFFNIGVNYLNANAPEDAIAWFTKAIARDPGYVDGYYRRALAYLQLGKNAESKADFQKVVELSPDSQMGEMAKKALASLP
jgi:tetratricopeptide (TPR) repeat protein